MSEKMTCPGCDSHTSAIVAAVRRDEPCPYCGLPADRIIDGENVRRDPASYGVPMTMPMGTTCAVHVHREWVPIEAHHIWPKGMGGPDVKANKVSVCANGHYSIHEVIRRLIANNGALPDARHFSAKVKALAMRGWVEAGKPTHGGGGE